MLSIFVFCVKYIMEFLEKLAKWIYNTNLSSEAKYGLKIPTWNQYANDHGIGWGGGEAAVAPPSHGIVFGTMADNVFSDN